MNHHASWGNFKMGSQTHELSQTSKPTELSWIQVFTDKKEPCVPIVYPQNQSA